MTPFIVAELSANHLGSFERARMIVDAAAKAGASAVKLQTWRPDAMCVDRNYTLTSGPWAGSRLFDLYRRAHTPWEWHRPLFDIIRGHGMVPFSAPFDWESADFLESLGVDRYKIASFELTDTPLIRHVASKGKHMIMSVGMASRGEIYSATRAAGRLDVTLVQCTSAYPAPSVDLQAMEALKNYAICVGISDHTPGIAASVAAVARGAVYVEKHLTLKRSDGGPDAAFSLEPDEFTQLVRGCRLAWECMTERKPAGEDPSLRRALWAVREIQPGEPLVLGDNIRTARPALGLPPSFDLSGRRAAAHIQACTPLLAEHISNHYTNFVGQHDSA